jgi:hypothetical protein
MKSVLQKEPVFLKRLFKKEKKTTLGMDTFDSTYEKKTQGNL